MTLNGLATTAYLFARGHERLRAGGRGAIIVDTTQQPVEGLGHPFGYFSPTLVEDRDDGEAKRTVQEYDPDQEFVIVVLKPHDRMSTYRVQTTFGVQSYNRPHSPSDGAAVALRTEALRFVGAKVLKQPMVIYLSLPTCFRTRKDGEVFEFAKCDRRE